MALRINLLDWRAARREYKRKRFMTQLAAAAAITIVVAGVLPVLGYNHLIHDQQIRNRYLQQQIDRAKSQLDEIRSLKDTREDLVKRMQVIGQLQRSRSAIVRYFNQITATVPNGVYLTSLDQNDATTTLDGVAESNARVSEYMTNLERSSGFSNPRLIVIERQHGEGPARAQFTLKVDSVPAQRRDKPGADKQAEERTK